MLSSGSANSTRVLSPTGLRAASPYNPWASLSDGSVPRTTETYDPHPRAGQDPARARSRTLRKSHSAASSARRSASLSSGHDQHLVPSGTRVVQAVRRSPGRPRRIEDGRAVAQLLAGRRQGADLHAHDQADTRDEGPGDADTDDGPRSLQDGEATALTRATRPRAVRGALLRQRQLHEGAVAHRSQSGEPLQPLGFALYGSVPRTTETYVPALAPVKARREDDPARSGNYVGSDAPPSGSKSLIRLVSSESSSS